jgi:hydroxypyruvate isomerase
MSKIKQSYCLPMYLKGGVKLDELVRRTAEIGFAAVEVWDRAGSPFEALVESARRHGLRIASMAGHGSLGVGLNDAAQHGRICDELHASIDLAAEVGVPGLICFSGNRRGRNDEASIEVCAEGLRPVMAHAEEKGINLNMELLNSKVDHPDYQCDHTTWGVRVCKAVGSPRARLLYDIYHMQIMEGDLIRTITENIQYIGHFHTAGNPRRGPLDDAQEIYYPAVMRAIAESGYDLYVGHEFSPKGDPVEGLAEAFGVCDV